MTVRHAMCEKLLAGLLFVISIITKGPASNSAHLQSMITLANSNKRRSAKKETNKGNASISEGHISTS